MAIYNGRILMRKGNEADFDPSKLMSGEWAVSLDAGIVRICLEAGKVIRMATYEAFEEDMKQIEAILLECQSIEEAVRRINTEVSEKLNACAEYVQQAKNYSEQAKTSEANAKSYMQSAKTSEENAKVSETNAKASENSAKEYENSAKLTEERAREVFESIPEDYSTISNDLYELAIKETASGEEIHVNDSSNLKLREFALYGKAKQNTTTGKNLLDNKATTQTINGVTIKVNNDKSISVNGTSTDRITLYVKSLNVEEIVKLNGYKLSGGTSNCKLFIESKTTYKTFAISSGSESVIDVKVEEAVAIFYQISKDTTVNETLYPMISLEGGEYEPYTNGATPRPDYPQPIEVSGASGSVSVKSCGKNIANCKCEDGSSNYHTLVKNGEKVNLIKGEKYTISVDLEVTSATRAYWNSASGIYSQSSFDINVGKNRYYLTFTAKDAILKENATLLTKSARSDDVLIKVSNCQLEYGDLTEYQPYKETLSTIPTENGLAGIKVSSGGNYTDQSGQQWICDEIVKYADGSGEYIQNIGKEIIDETSNIIITTIGTHVLFRGDAVPHAKQGSYRSICSHYNGNGSLNAGQFRVDNTNWYLRVDKSGFNTVEEFKSFLSEEKNNGRPLTFYYELKTPIHTPLTAEEIAEIEKLHTFYPVTNISNDADCGMSVTYYADSKNYINNQLAIMKQEQEETMANMLLLMPTEVQAMMIENDTNDLLKESEI